MIGFRECVMNESNYRGGRLFSSLLERARELRKDQTSAEEILWEVLRNRQFLNLKFRRQHQIEKWIVDFYNHENKLILELDGEIHLQKIQQERDQNKDLYLSSTGFNILRIKNDEVYSDLSNVFRKIYNYIRE